MDFPPNTHEIIPDAKIYYSGGGNGGGGGEGRYQKGWERDRVRVKASKGNICYRQGASA